MVLKPNKFKSRNYVEATRFALQGLTTGLIRERNIRLLTIIFIGVNILAWAVQLNPIAWSLVIISSVVILAAELINTSIEAVADAIHPDHHEGIQYAKDTAAAAVLVLCFAAILIGLLVLWPALAPYFQYTLER